MLAFPPTYAIPISLVFICTVLLFCYAPVRERLRPQRLLILALAATLICVPVYAINYQQTPAYDVGSVVFRDRAWDFTIWPGNTERIDDISNIHAVAAAYITIVCDSNVTFYLIDQNRPEAHHREANYSEVETTFRLPYLYTETGVPAQWSICLTNSNPTLLHVRIESIWLEDSIEMAWWGIEYSLYLPLVLLFAVWMALGLPMLILYRRRAESQEFMTGLALTILGVGLGVVLASLVPFYLLSPSSIGILVIVALFLVYGCNRKKTEAPPAPTPAVV